MSFIVEKLNREDSFHQQLILTDLKDLKIDFYKKYYPRVADWYTDKLISGFTDGSRIVHVVRKESRFYGMSIAKVSSHRKRNKLCTFFLLPEARGNGTGSELMKRTLYELNSPFSTKPILVTIPQERIRENAGGKIFIDFLAGFGFLLMGKVPNRYRPGKDEYISTISAIKASWQTPMSSTIAEALRYRSFSELNAQICSSSVRW